MNKDARDLRRILHPWQPWRGVSWTPHHLREIPGTDLARIGYSAILDQHGEIDYYIVGVQTLRGRVRFAIVDFKGRTDPSWNLVWRTFTTHDGYIRAREELRYVRVAKINLRQPQPLHQPAV
ncbi:MAG: hypothetical protein K0S68_402 [Candidatus Saccharibacteria bacterium]|nr:hypothetical protein [Candidatus Saccharibacteria bacterium]